MRNLVIVTILIFWVAVLGFLGYGLTSQNNNANQLASASLSGPDGDLLGGESANNNQTGTADAGQVSGLSLQDVALHNTEKDCWMVIAGKVYDVTSYLPFHPGGPGTMIPYCGKEATAAFQTKDLNPGKPHSNSVQDLLNQYYVGTLGQKPLNLSNGIVSGQVLSLQTTVSPKTSQTTSNPALTPMPPPIPNPAPTSTPTPTPPPTSTTFTTTQVATHNTSADCWFIISNKVYNVTAYLPYHPAGSGAITPYCGKDATAAFASVGHSTNAANLLASYYVGDLYIAAIPTPPPAPAPTPPPAWPPREDEDDDD